MGNSLKHGEMLAMLWQSQRGETVKARELGAWAMQGGLSVAEMHVDACFKLAQIVRLRAVSIAQH
jgi:hypothetical protein